MVGPLHCSAPQGLGGGLQEEWRDLGPQRCYGEQWRQADQRVWSCKEGHQTASELVPHCSGLVGHRGGWLERCLYPGMSQGMLSFCRSSWSAMPSFLAMRLVVWLEERTKNPSVASYLCSLPQWCVGWVLYQAPTREQTTLCHGSGVSFRYLSLYSSRCWYVWCPPRGLGIGTIVSTPLVLDDLEMHLYPVVWWSWRRTSTSMMSVPLMRTVNAILVRYTGVIVCTHL